MLAQCAKPCDDPERCFWKPCALEQDWGYAALIEFEGKRILFDTGDNIEVFQKNVEALHVDLTRLDMVVITHAHGDHTSGLRYVLSKNPKVKLYVPEDPFFTGTVLPSAFLSTDARPELPAKMRYFSGGSRPEPKGWVAWTDTNMTAVSESMSIAPHIRLVSLVSEKPAFKGLREISLVLDTPPAQSSLSAVRIQELNESWLRRLQAIQAKQL